MITSIKKYEFKTGLHQEFEIVDLETRYREFKDNLTTIQPTSFFHIIWFQQASPKHLVDFEPIKIATQSLFVNYVPDAPHSGMLPPPSEAGNKSKRYVFTHTDYTFSGPKSALTSSVLKMG